MEMKFLRRVNVVTKRDKIKSETIKKEFEIKATLSKTEEMQINWCGHLVAMPELHQMKQIWKTKGIETLIKYANKLAES